jgi:lactate permease
MPCTELCRVGKWDILRKMPISSLPLTILVFLATTPILVVLYLMIGRQWGGSKAGPVGWLTAVIISLLFFGTGPQLIWIASLKAVLLSLFVLYIIWMALLLYHTVNEAGAITAIGQEMPGIAQGRAAQALLLAWIFGSFLQGATGFGVPAAVVAPLLVGIGFASTPAVVIALLGHTWAVTFGSLGSSFISLIAATGVSGTELADPVAATLVVAALGSGLAILWIVDKQSAMRRRGLFVLMLAAVMGGTQWLIARSGLYSLAALGGGLAGLLVAIPLLSRESVNVGAFEEGDSFPQRRKRLLIALLPYGILITVVVLGTMIIPDLLDAVIISPTFPEICTSLGVCIPEGPGRSINLFGHGGALLFYATVLIFLWYRWRGTLPTAPSKEYSANKILSKTIRGSIKPTIGIYSMVAMATIMEHAGMTQLLANVLSQSGPFFPFLSPFIGALGAFMTGSNTNSNVVFGQLQKQTALALSISVPIILAGQTAGGAIGSNFAPAKVIVGASTVGDASEGDVLRTLAKLGLIIIGVIGVAVWVAITLTN